MNINLKKKKLQKLNVHEASAGHYTVGRVLRYKAKKGEEEDEVDFGLTDMPRLKREYASEAYKYMTPIGYKNAGQKVFADELLSLGFGVNPNMLRYASRDEVKELTGVELPSSDLLGAVHYYLKDRIAQHPSISSEEAETKFVNFLDETALLAVGALIEKWMDDLLDETSEAFRMYMEPDEDEDLTELMRSKRRMSEWHARQRKRRRTQQQQQQPVESSSASSDSSESEEESSDEE